MKINFFFRSFVLALCCALVPVGESLAGPQRDAVCQGGCGGGCGPCSSNGGGGGGGAGIAWGGMTQRSFDMIKQCNGAPGCVLMNGVILVPMGLMFDAPVWICKGVGYGIYYGGIGIGKGVVGIGHGIAYPFKAAAESRRHKLYAASQPVNCKNDAAGGGSFDAYRAWEECKRQILKRQKALTKLYPSNKADAAWCKGHIPLSSGPNTGTWLKRCNDGGTTPFDPQPVAVAATQTAAPQTASPNAAGAVAAPVAAQTGAAPAAGQTAPTQPSSADGTAGAPGASPAIAPNPTPAANTVALPSTTALKPGGDEQTKTAGQGGFDSAGPMAGSQAKTPDIPTPPSSPAETAQPQPTSTAPSSSPELIPAKPAPSAAVAPAPVSAAAATPASSDLSQAARPGSEGDVSLVAQNAVAAAAARKARAAAAKRAAVAPGNSKGLVAARKVLNCALKPLSTASGDHDFMSGVRAEARKVFFELAAVAPGGKADVQQVYSIARDTTAHSKAGDKQVTLQAGIQRMDVSGEIHVDVSFSAKDSAAESVEGDTIVFVAADGSMTPVKLSDETKRCIGL